jgi:hypothetical protein
MYDSTYPQRAAPSQRAPAHLVEPAGSRRAQVRAVVAGSGVAVAAVLLVLAVTGSRAISAPGPGPAAAPEPSYAGNP